MTLKGEKQNRKYDPTNWKTTGPNKRRKLDNIRFSLNEDDYQEPNDYEWKEVLNSIILNSLEDLARYPGNTERYKSAHKFIFSDDIETWMIAFNYDMDAEYVRSSANKILRDAEFRDAFLMRCQIDKKIQNKIRRMGNPAE